MINTDDLRQLAYYLSYDLDYKDQGDDKLLRATANEIDHLREAQQTAANEIDHLRERVMTKGSDLVWQIGEKYLIRTCTFYYVGRLVTVTPNELVLKDASRVADIGRFSETLRAGVFKEIEPFVENAIINRGAIVDGTIWNGKLPREAK